MNAFRRFRYWQLKVSVPVVRYVEVKSLPFEGEKERVKFSDTSISVNYLYYKDVFSHSMEICRMAWHSPQNYFAENRLE